MAAQNKAVGELHEIYGRVGKTEQDLAALSTKVDQIISTLNRIVERSDRPPPATNWVAIAALVVSVITGAGMYLQSRLMPIEREQAHSREQLDQIAARELARERFLGEVGAKVERLQ